MSNVEGIVRISNFKFRICFGFRVSDFGFSQFATHVFTDSDEFHLRGDDSVAGVPKLRNRMRFRPENAANAEHRRPNIERRMTARSTVTLRLRRWMLDVASSTFAEPTADRWTFSGRMRSMRVRKKTIIYGLDFSAFVFFHVAAVADPFPAERRQPLRDVTVKIRITPWAAGVVHAHRLIDFDFAANRFGRREGDFAKRHAHVGM